MEWGFLRALLGQAKRPTNPGNQAPGWEDFGGNTEALIEQSVIELSITHYATICPATANFEVGVCLVKKQASELIDIQV